MEMNRDGKSAWTQDRVRVIGRFEGPFRRTDPMTGKRGRKFLRAMVRMAGTDNVPMEMILQTNRRMEATAVIVEMELRHHSDGREFLNAYPCLNQRHPANSVFETDERF